MGLLRSLVVVWNRACVVPILLVLGERALVRGRLGAARARFVEAVRRSPSCFRAHFGLARVHAARDDSVAARRELGIARHLAPSRYRELRHALPVPYRDEDLGADPDRVASGVAVRDTRAASPALTDDLVDEEERARFRALGPIRDAEVRDVDWDQLLAELLRRDA